MTTGFQTLQDWLAWQETLHPRAIDLGLERVAEVHRRLGGGRPAPLVITVAGTNGKGSSVALLDSILRAAGYRTGTYTSPHLLHYNERIRINGEAALDAEICQAFARIDQARADISLTYFEFGTLAALQIFHSRALDVVILEVGLGGRLDATNIIDADLALITGISLDHTQWLGASTEEIAAEKAGIMRRGRPAVYAAQVMPAAISATAQGLGAPLYAAGRDFTQRADNGVWSWCGAGGEHRDLPLPALSGTHQLANAAGVLMALHLLRARCPLSRPAIEQGLRSVRVAGRFQRRSFAPDVYLDVAHNPEAACALARQVAALPNAGRVHAVAGFMGDKDIAAILRSMRDVVDQWYLCALPGARAAPQAQLALAAAQAQLPAVAYFAAPAPAWQAARAAAAGGDTVLVFGSFVTVADIMARLG